MEITYALFEADAFERGFFRQIVRNILELSDTEEVSDSWFAS